MFFSRKRSCNQPVPGSVHERIIGGRTVEQAEVLEVSQDGMGIPHVRYRVTHIHASRRARAGLRVLALSSFLSQFAEISQAA